MKISFLNEPNQFGYEHESTIECELDPSVMKFICDLNEFEPSKVLDILKDKCNELIRKWLEARFTDINLDEFEDGFDSWWGMGSVTMCELELQFNFNYSQSVMTVEIS